MENMCSNCGFYKTPPLFWGGSTEPLLCDCPKERSYSEEDLREAFKHSRQAFIFEKDMPCVYDSFEEWFEQFKKK